MAEVLVNIHCLDVEKKNHKQSEQFHLEFAWW